MVERGFTPGQTVGVTQRKRVSGAGNGYFEISGANSYGYCAQNKKSFWGNDQTKYGPVQEWNDPIVRKILYYSPGGPGYTGGNLGYDMDMPRLQLDIKMIAVTIKEEQEVILPL